MNSPVRYALTAFIVILLSARLPAAEGPVATKTEPAAEPIREQFSAAKAAEFLDANAHAHEEQCFACHATYAYLMARPKLTLPSSTHRETRLALEQSVDKLPTATPAGTNPPPLRITDAVMTAAALALHDASTTGTLHPQTRKALDRMWDLQRDEGHWDWSKADEAPSAIDDHFGVTMAAFATGIAPEDYASTPQARQGLEKILRLRAQPSAGNDPPAGDARAGLDARGRAPDRRPARKRSPSYSRCNTWTGVGRWPVWPIGSGKTARRCGPTSATATVPASCSTCCAVAARPPPIPGCRRPSRG